MKLKNKISQKLNTNKLRKNYRNRFLNLLKVEKTDYFYSEENIKQIIYLQKNFIKVNRLNSISKNKNVIFVKEKFKQFGFKIDNSSISLIFLSCKSIKQLKALILYMISKAEKNNISFLATRKILVKDGAPSEETLDKIWEKQKVNNFIDKNLLGLLSNHNLFDNPEFIYHIMVIKRIEPPKTKKNSLVKNRSITKNMGLNRYKMYLRFKHKDGRKASLIPDHVRASKKRSSRYNFKRESFKNPNSESLRFRLALINKVHKKSRIRKNEKLKKEVAVFFKKFLSKKYKREKIYFNYKKVKQKHVNFWKKITKKKKEFIKEIKPFFYKKEKPKKKVYTKSSIRAEQRKRRALRRKSLVKQKVNLKNNSKIEIQLKKLKESIKESPTFKIVQKEGKRPRKILVSEGNKEIIDVKDKKIITAIKEEKVKTNTPIKERPESPRERMERLKNKNSSESKIEQVSNRKEVKPPPEWRKK